MTRFVVLCAALLAPLAVSAQGTSLKDARQGFRTKLLKKARTQDKLPPPPRGFKIVDYPTAIGPMKALLTPPRDPKVKQPAMVWITGGFPSGGIGESAWKGVDPKNDQSAKAYRLAGMVMMYPTLRGSYGNPGVQEAFLGEVDDVLAAVEYLSKLDYVDPKQIYLGGHSTGGTLALLVAAASSRFKGVISFGPVTDPAADYGADSVPFDTTRPREAKVRAPIHYLGQVRSPTWVIEGALRGNADRLRAMKAATSNPKLHFAVVQEANHFDVLAPVNALLARAIGKKQDLGAIDPAAIQGAFTAHRRAQREADDLVTISRLRRAGVELEQSVVARHYVLGREAAKLKSLAKRLERTPGYGSKPLQERKDRRGRPFFILTITRSLQLQDLKTVFATSRAVSRAATRAGGQYDGWDTE